MTSFTTRSATFDDLPELVELFNRAAAAIGEENQFTAESYTAEWAAQRLFA